MQTKVKMEYKFDLCQDLKVEKVVFVNSRKTIVRFSDGTTSTAVTNNEPFDEEKGFAMAVLKKFCSRAEQRELLKSAVRSHMFCREGRHLLDVLAENPLCSQSVESYYEHLMHCDDCKSFLEEKE